METNDTKGKPWKNYKVGMKKYTGIVTVTYQMEIETEAESDKEAEDKMIDFYLTNSHTAYGDIEVKFTDKRTLTFIKKNYVPSETKEVTSA
jgi:hypothetical protein